MHDFGVMEGVTELRIGTYILMDVSQGNAIGTYDRCAASVLTTVISKPTSERVITDVGAKGITMQSRSQGICATTGLGYIKTTVYILTKCMMNMRLSIMKNSEIKLQLVKSLKSSQIIFAQSATSMITPI